MRSLLDSGQIVKDHAQNDVSLMWTHHGYTERPLVKHCRYTNIPRYFLPSRNIIYLNQGNTYRITFIKIIIKQLNLII